MRIRLAIPDELDDKERKSALDAALESVTRSVTGLVTRGIVPPASTAIKSGRVRWQPEPPGDEHFDLPTTVLARGWGDCDDLAPWHAATLRASGTDPNARAVVKRSGPSRWHAFVMRGDGSTEDPSRHAGMGHSVSGGGGSSPIHAPMSADSRLCIALCPTRDPRHPLVWFARCDAPDKCEPWDWTASAHHPEPRTALLRAISTVRGVCGDEIDDLDLARLEALNDLLLGCGSEECGEALDEVFGEDETDGILEDAEQSVGFFGNIVRAVTKPLAPIARTVAPLARAAMPFTASTPAGGMVRSLTRGDPRALAASLVPTAMAHVAPGQVARTFQGAPVRAAVQQFAPQAARYAAQAAQQVVPGLSPALQQFLSFFTQPGWAPPTVKFEPGQVMHSTRSGPAFMMF